MPAISEQIESALDGVEVPVTLSVVAWNWIIETLPKDGVKDMIRRQVAGHIHRAIPELTRDNQ